ncbi:UvrD-helicase domain-containing protein [Microcoleus sp. FACHB-53]|nr:UvrD-helicase domain-containing protein [Microcoleus sp. FACHB-53]
MSLTTEQQTAAYAKTSVAVTAGAGTGKTHMLAERYLYYLRENDFSPLEIVAVTFTEKAAKELRSRIRALVAKQLPDRTDLLAELEAAQISTLHALASRICREHPNEAGVPPDFTILDELEGELWLSDCLEAALAQLPARLYELIPYSLMSKALESLIADPIAAERALCKGTQNWSNLAAQLQQQALEELLNHPSWEEARNTLNQFVGKAGDRLEEFRQVAVQAMTAIESKENLQESLAAINSIKLNVGSKKNWQAGALEIVKDVLKNLRGQVEKALDADLITLEFGSIDTQLLEMLPALREAYGSVLDYLNSVKRRSRILTFADLEVHALRALSDLKVQSYYQQRWQVFLVDEFQDTNPTQAELLEVLTHHSQLTIVGDVKQSIYGFRRADVRVFNQFRDRILNTDGVEVILNKSFRTHQSLITQINGIFAPVLGELHQDLSAHRNEAPHPHPHLRVEVVQGEDGVNKAQRQLVEAHHIAQRIKAMIDAQTPIHDKRTNQLRPLTPGDIAILSRTWEPLEIYGEALAAVGIPIAPAGGGNLMATREAKDAWALLRFLADSNDDLALIAVLRSPFFAVSDRVLFAVVQTLPKETSWWQHVKGADVPELSIAVNVLNQLLFKRNEEPPTRLLQIADRLTGYTAVIANLPGAARREADWRGFRELVRSLEQGTGDLFGVVRRLKRLVDKEVNVPRLPLEAGDAVALMTIYAAKGLEWPVVVVTDLTRSKPNTNTEPIYFDPEFGVALAWENDAGEKQKPVLYRCLEHLRKQREEAEALRVLYVALTRVRDQLILTAADTRGTGLERLRPGLEAAGILIEELPFNPANALPPVPPAPPIPDALPQLLINSVGSGLFELPVTALSEYARCPKRFQFRFVEGHPGLGEGVARASQVGTLVHSALERGIRDADTLARFAEGSVSREWVEEAIALAQRFDRDPAFALFQEALASREQAVTLTVEQLRLNGVVDLVGNDWVLDFKTDQEVTPQHHRFQLWAYAWALARQKAHIAYLRHNQLHTFDATELKIASQEVQTLVQGILNGHYPAVPSQENCRGCSYSEICELRHNEPTEWNSSTVEATASVRNGS